MNKFLTIKQIQTEESKILFFLHKVAMEKSDLGKYAAEI